MVLLFINENIGVGLLLGWGCIIEKFKECVFSFVGVLVFNWLIWNGRVCSLLVSVIDGGLFVWLLW